MIAAHHPGLPVRAPSPARRPVREALERWLIARAMALEPIGDIADVSLTESTGAISVHGFEDQDLSNYSIFNSAGSSIVSSPALTGSYTLEQGTSSGGETVHYLPLGNNGDFPAPGDKWAWKTSTAGNTRSNITLMFGWACPSAGQDADGYEVRLEFDDHQGNGEGLVIGANTTAVTYEVANFTLSYTDTYRIEVHWKSGGDIRAVCYNEDTSTQEADITASNPGRFSSQDDIRWSTGAGGGEVYYDNAPVSII